MTVVPWWLLPPPTLIKFSPRRQIRNNKSAIHLHNIFFASIMSTFLDEKSFVHIIEEDEKWGLFFLDFYFTTTTTTRRRRRWRRRAERRRRGGPARRTVVMMKEKKPSSSTFFEHLFISFETDDNWRRPILTLHERDWRERTFRRLIFTKRNK